MGMDIPQDEAEVVIMEEGLHKGGGVEAEVVVEDGDPNAPLNGSYHFF